MIAPNNANKTRIPKKAATFFRFTLTIKVSSSSRSSLFRYKNEESIPPPMISSGNRYGDLNIMVVRAATSATATENGVRSEEHTSELQSLMRISYAVFCLKKKKEKNNNTVQSHILYYT